MAASFDDGSSGARLYEEPLVRTAMTVVRSTFGLTGGNGHRRCLGAAIADHYLESESEPQVRLLHRYRFFRVAAPFFASAVRVRFGRCAMVRLRLAAVAAFLMFRFAAVR